MLHTAAMELQLKEFYLSKTHYTGQRISRKQKWPIRRRKKHKKLQPAETLYKTIKNQI